MEHLLDALLDPWRSGIERRALVELILLGSFSGALGFWVATYRLSYPAESLAHGLLPGLVLAALAGLPLLLGGVAGVAVAALAIGLAARDARVGSDTATAVAVTGLLGLGGLLALAPETPARLEELLFGDPLGVDDGDLLVAAVLALGGAAALFGLQRPLAAVALDAQGARSLSIGPDTIQLALLTLLAAALAVAVQGLGSLLVLAVLVAPAVAVRRHVRSPGQGMVAAGTVAVLAGIAGIYASDAFSSAAGASVALALCLAAALGAALPARQAGRSGGPLLRSRPSQ
jgi:ABC-type Mn2+/Zn2+ transport system permease subunit